MLRSSLARPLGAAASRLSVATHPSSLQPQLQQTRNNWQVILRKRLDKRTGKEKFEDWDYLSMRMEEPQLLTGTTLLNRHLQQVEHIKPTELRRRLNSAKVYKRNVKRLDDLKNYIKFTQEADAKARDEAN